MPVMDLLKIGDLARRSGLTVRALHHFDQIGLLTPSARNDAGYRLYNRDDVARLHGIQALRQLGLPLKDIGGMLAGDSAALPMVVARQLQALDQQISQASQLRARLALLMDRFSAGAQPEIGEWLASLALMATYSRYFNPDEVRRIVINWQAVRAEWPPLMQAVRQMMDACVPANDLAMQPLAHRWMGLIHHWLGGDFALIERWGRLFVQEPAVRQAGAPDLAMVAYVEQATALRLAAWLRHFTLADLAAFRWVSHGVWQALAGQVQALMAAGVPPGAAAARALAALSGALPRLRVVNLGITLLAVDGLVGLLFMPMGQIRTLWQGALLAALIGVLGGYIQVAVFTWIQRRVAPALLGRAMGVFMFIFMGLAPLSAAVTGWLLRSVPLATVFLAAGGALVGLVAVTLASGAMRRVVDAAPVDD